MLLPYPFYALLVAITFLGVFPLDVILPSVPGMARHFGVSTEALSANIALFPVVYALGQWLTGLAADRLGLCRVFVVWVLLTALASAAAALSHQFTTFSAWRIVQALGCSGFGLLHAVVQVQVPAAQRPRLRIVLTTVGGAFIALSPLLGVVLESLGGWQVSFWLYTGLGLAVALYAPRVLPAHSQAAARTAAASAACWPAFRRGAALAGLAFSVHFAFIVVSPVLFIERLGLSLWGYGAVMLVYGGVYVLGGVLALRLAGGLSTAQQAQLGFALMLAGAASLSGLYAVVGLQAWAVLLAAVLATLGVCLARPAATCQAMDAWPGRPGAAAGWLGLLTFLAGGLLSLAASQLLAQGDHWLPLWLLLLASVGLVLALRPAAEPAQPASRGGPVR